MSEPETAPPPADSGFAVEVPGFTGPFRLLADLVLEQKVDVCDVPIATVTDRFLAYAKEAERWNLEEATWFLADLRDPPGAQARTADPEARGAG